MKNTITITIRADDAEPILRKAAEEAAKFGAILDYATRKTWRIPHKGHGERFDDARAIWQSRFLAAKRLVESFDVEYEQVSESEALTVDYAHVGGTRKIMRVPGIGSIGYTSNSKPDYKHPFPSFRGGVFEEACRQAADRVVRRWRAGL